MKRFFWLLIFVFASVGFAAAQQAVPEAVARPDARRGQRVTRLLNLTPEQQAQIKAIRERTSTERRALAERHREAQRQLEEAIYGDATGEAVITQRARELAAAYSELTLFRARAEYEIRRLLTSDQLAALRQARANAQRDRRQNGRWHKRQHRSPRAREGMREGAPGNSQP